MVTPDKEKTKGVLSVRDETYTIGSVVARYVFELEPGIAFVSAVVVPHEKMLRITVSHAVSDPGEIGEILIRAVKHSYAVFGKIQKGVREKAF